MLHCAWRAPKTNFRGVVKLVLLCQERLICCIIRFKSYFATLYHIGAETKWLPFPDDIFKCFFFKFQLKFHLKFVPKAPINNIPALVQIKTWCRRGARPLSEPIMLDHRRIYASHSLNELIRTKNYATGWEIFRFHREDEIPQHSFRHSASCHGIDIC